MANISDAAYKALTGRTRKLETGGAAAQVAHLEKKYGSMAEASRQTGIPRTTLRRWKAGKGEPKGMSAQRLTRAVRETLVPEGRRKRVKGSTGNPRTTRAERLTGRGSRSTRSGHGGLTVTAEVLISSDLRERPLYLGQHVSPERGEELLDAFLSGDDARFESLLHEVVGAYFGSNNAPGWSLENVTTVSFEPIR